MPIQCVSKKSEPFQIQISYNDSLTTNSNSEGNDNYLYRSATNMTLLDCYTKVSHIYSSHTVKIFSTGKFLVHLILLLSDFRLHTSSPCTEKLKIGRFSNLAKTREETSYAFMNI
jgi:hypothetical protein